MTVRYASHISTRKTPQNTAIMGETQVKNNAGGFVYEVDKFSALERFLILGFEGGTYYVKEKPLTIANATVVNACLVENFKRTVDTIVSVSEAGRASKNDPAILALALAAASKNVDARAYALAHLDRVCRIPTHLFHFLSYVQELRGWGRALRKAVAKWYENHPSLAYSVVKYQQRDGWAHKDALRLSHPKLVGEKAAVARWIIGASTDGRSVARKGTSPVVYAATGEFPRIIMAFEEAKTASKARLIQLIHENNLSWEMIPSKMTTDKDVMTALFMHMPLGAMLRQLGKLTSLKVLETFSAEATEACRRLTNPEALKKSRLHPMAILNALRVYKMGHGERGSLSWSPVGQIVDALDASFYAAFGNVESTGKNVMLALDVSGSMRAPIAGTALSCREAAAAMALVTANVEPSRMIVGFTSGTGRSQWPRYGTEITELAISPRQRLDDVVKYLANMPFGGTDCALPMVYATERKLDVDAFCVYTDSETWAGNIHPSQALRNFRATMNKPDAKQVVVGMTATNFTIADPKDHRTLDVVGFDTNTPNAISEFIKG